VLHRIPFVVVDGTSFCKRKEIQVRAAYTAKGSPRAFFLFLQGTMHAPFANDP
jgi:hypothetical protein